MREAAPPGEVSRLLRRWSGGGKSALSELTPVVYGELRRPGRASRPRQRPASLLQPRLSSIGRVCLAGQEGLSLENRRLFYELAAKLMRDILVDQLRRQQSLKRGGTRIRVDLEDATPRVELAGLTIAETAEALDVSHGTMEQERTFARGWLRRERNRRRGGQIERGGARP